MIKLTLNIELFKIKNDDIALKILYKHIKLNAAICVILFVIADEE